MTKPKQYSFNQGTARPRPITGSRSGSGETSMPETSSEATYSFYGRDTNPSPDAVAARLGLPVVMPPNSK